MASEGGFLNAPDVYMDKIAVGGGLPEGVVDLDNAPGQNLKNLAKAKKAEVSDLVACILDRPRHAELIAKVREAGARIMLISDGDVSGVIATSTPASAAGLPASASRTSTANTASSISPRATSCSPPPASPTAPCCAAPAAS